MGTIVMRDEKLPFQSLKCPSCGNRMEKGYVTLISGYASALFFSEQKISWAMTSTLPVGTSDKDLIMDNSLVLAVKDNYRREGFRCKACQLVIIDRKRHDYRGYSALEGKNEFDF